MQNIIISGDVNKVNFKDMLLEKKFESQVYFSSLAGKDLPQLEKYHGYVVTNDLLKGSITSIGD